MSSENCIFCKIVQREIPGTPLYEDDQVLAFRDLHPQAPTHILIIPKKHYAHLEAVPEEELGIVGELYRTARRLAKQEGLDAGYRLTMNVKEAGGQTVFHVHLHLLGGRQLGALLA